MMPLGDDNSGRRTVPIVTYAIIAANVIAFVLFEMFNPEVNQLIAEYGAVPARIMSGQGLITLLTSMFLHDPGSLLHIGGNMLFLWIFGDNVEDALGHGLYLAFYLVCGLAASMAQVLVGPASQVPGIGASGAIAGVLAAYIVLFGSNPVRVLLGRGITTVPSYVMIGLWIVIQVVSGFGSFGSDGGGVAYFAHIGGFAAGLVLTFLLRGVAAPRLPAPRAQRVQRMR